MFNPWIGNIPWRREWLPTPVLLLGESHGQRSLAGYSPWDHTESDTMEQPSARACARARAHTHTHETLWLLWVALGMLDNRELGTGVGFTKKYSATHYQFCVQRAWNSARMWKFHLMCHQGDANFYK